MNVTLNGTTRLAQTNCPYCARKLNAVGTPDGSPGRPGTGDTTVCIGCARVLFFRADLSLRKPDPGELETVLLGKPAHAADIARLQSIIRSIPPEPMR